MVDKHVQGKMSSLVCLKKGPVIEGEKSISSQLRIISLSEGNMRPFHSYVSAAMAPYFKSFVRESGKADKSRWKRRKKTGRKLRTFKRSRGRLAAKQRKCSDADLRPDSHPRPRDQGLQTTNGEQYFASWLASKVKSGFQL